MEFPNKISDEELYINLVVKRENIAKYEGSMSHDFLLKLKEQVSTIEFALGLQEEGE